MSYAAETKVSVERTRYEIEKALASAGACRFAYLSDAGSAIVAFEFRNKLVRFTLPLPVSEEYALTAAKRLRSNKERLAAQAQDHRARWRALGLGIKAKLVFVESGIRTFEQEFLADFVMPNGKTLGESAIPQLDDAAKSGRMPTLSLSA